MSQTTHGSFQSCLCNDDSGHTHTHTQGERDETWLTEIWRKYRGGGTRRRYGGEDKDEKRRRNEEEKKK